MTRHIRHIAAMLALGVAALTGCSSPADDTDNNKSTASKQEAALEKSVRAYTKALFGGDPSGYDYISVRCREELSEDQFAALAKQAHTDQGSLEIKNFKVDQMSGDLARVDYGVGVPKFERKGQPWVREVGVWRWDACQAGGQ
ncbi:hypothetical protein [Streptomyces olivaceus]|uniref:hypothetical protein n=1 Tax=Streptomyces olivaceus TaxID=47716 RepID=UPI0022EF9BBD|nr:hypothetical protein [Streptomyces olivaceus]GHI91710.1 hypothetical protein TPA0905_11810 [Streptomyces olivaceus]